MMIITHIIFDTIFKISKLYFLSNFVFNSNSLNYNLYHRKHEWVALDLNFEGAQNMAI